MKLISTIAAAAFLASAVSASATICLLTVYEEVHMEGQCTFRTDKNGSFSVTSQDQDLIAHLDVLGAGVGRGEFYVRSLERREILGDLSKHGGCWSNSIATLCAWAD